MRYRILRLLVKHARVHRAEHLLARGRDRAVAHDLEREDGEGLLELHSELLDAKEEDGDDACAWQQGDCVR